jgi:hypothetical protein
MIGGRKNFLFDLRSPIQSEFRYDEEVPFREKEEKVEPSVRESKVRERNNVTVGGDEGSRLDQRLFSTVTTHRQPSSLASLRAVFVDQIEQNRTWTDATDDDDGSAVCVSLTLNTFSEAVSNVILSPRQCLVAVAISLVAIIYPRLCHQT